MPFGISRSPEIADRRDFAHLCNKHGLVEAVEVGTDRGLFAFDFVTKWKGYTLLCVDPYLPYPEMPFDRLPDLVMAVVRLAPFAEHVKFVRETSLGFLSKYDPNARIDFIYIDGAHDYDSVREDVAAWWDRLMPGGILAGHDFDEHHPGVVRAVTEFARANDLAIYHTFEAGTTPSWYVHKPKCESPA
jgi:hypothetical protein